MNKWTCLDMLPGRRTKIIDIKLDTRLHPHAALVQHFPDDLNVGTLDSALQRCSVSCGIDEQVLITHHHHGLYGDCASITSFHSRDVTRYLSGISEWFTFKNPIWEVQALLP